MKNDWMWMMNYCHEKGLPPAEAWVWDRAKRAYQEAQQEIIEDLQTTTNKCNMPCGALA